MNQENKHSEDVGEQQLTKYTEFPLRHFSDFRRRLKSGYKRLEAFLFARKHAFDRNQIFDRKQRQLKSLNTIVEHDHRFINRRVKPG